MTSNKNKVFVYLFVSIFASLFSLGAQAVVIEFTTTVTFATGPHGAIFTPGSAATISYELDTGVADANASPSEGVFFNASQSLTFEIIDAGLATDFSGGTSQTFDNTPNPDDQWYTSGLTNLNGATLGGELITFTDLHFIGTTAMLSSDALPTSLLSNATSIFAFFQTDSGFTQVNFSTNITAVPGPAAGLVLVIGLLGFLFVPMTPRPSS